MKASLLIAVVVLLSLSYGANAQKVYLSRPSSGETWDAGFSEYISWSGGGTYISIYYRYLGSSVWYTVVSSTYNYKYYYWDIPTTMSGSISVRVCTSGDLTSCSETPISIWVNSYNKTVYYINPAAWVIPTVVALCIIAGVVSCWRRQRYCFRRHHTDVYVPVTSAVVVTDAYVSPAQPVAYAQPVGYTPAPAQPYYPPQPQPYQQQQGAYQQPYYQPTQ